VLKRGMMRSPTLLLVVATALGLGAPGVYGRTTRGTYGRARVPLYKSRAQVYAARYCMHAAEHLEAEELHG